MSRAKTKDFAFEKKSAVTGYELAWNTEQNFGIVNLTLDDAEMVHLRVNSLAELAGLAAILDKNPIYTPNEKWIAGHFGIVRES